MVEEIGFVKLRLYSDHIFHSISERVQKDTKFPLVKQGEYSYGYDRINDNEILRINCEHNGTPIAFIVAFKQGLLLDVDKNKKTFLKEIEYVATYLIDYIHNNYIHSIKE